MSLRDRYRARHAKPSFPASDQGVADSYADQPNFLEHEVVKNRAGQSGVIADSEGVRYGIVGQAGPAISIPLSEPQEGLWNRGVRGESVSSGSLHIDDEEARREEFLARATERAERRKSQRHTVEYARAQGYELGLEQGLEIGRHRAQDDQRRAENAAWDAEQDKALKVFNYPRFQAMVKHLGPATVVNLTAPGKDVHGEEHLLQTTGLSVCAPCDVYDREVGTQIAFARALTLMADMLAEAAASRTRHVKERY